MAFVFLSIVIATYHSCRASNSSIQFIDDRNKTNENVNITYTSNDARRLISLAKSYYVKARDFGRDKYRFLNAVAAIRIDRPNKGDPTDCSGALIHRGGAEGLDDIFVLTAAHCLYAPHGKSAEHVGFWNKGVLRVEFGLTDNLKPGSKGIIECRVDSYRISAKYPILPVSTRNTHDYGIIKLRSCKGKDWDKVLPFTIKNWDAAQQDLRKFARAGYPEGSRTLRMQKKAEHRKDQNDGDFYKHFVILRGVSHHGDSGSPVFDWKKPHRLRAVLSGGLKTDTSSIKKKLAVKITSIIHNEINQMMRGKAGIPDDATVSSCKYNEKECWSECGESCPTDGGYEQTPNYIPCKEDKSKRNYLCKKKIGLSAYIGISDQYYGVFGDEYDEYDEYNDEYNEYGDEYIDDDVVDEFDDYKKSRNIQRIEIEMLLREMGLSND